MILNNVKGNLLYSPIARSYLFRLYYYNDCRIFRELSWGMVI